jgi:hypothetical protein
MKFELKTRKQLGRRVLLSTMIFSSWARPSRPLRREVPEMTLRLLTASALFLCVVLLASNGAACPPNPTNCVTTRWPMPSGGDLDQSLSAVLSHLISLAG